MILSMQWQVIYILSIIVTLFLMITLLFYALRLRHVSGPDSLQASWCLPFAGPSPWLLWLWLPPKQATPGSMKPDCIDELYPELAERRKGKETT